MPKFQNTHNMITEQALRLFHKHGYSDTSVTSISKAAGITEMTFYRHFPSKEAVLLTDPFDPVIADKILHQHSSKRALRATISGFREAWSEIVSTVEDDMRVRLKIIAETPELASASLKSTSETVEAVKSVLIARGSSEIEATVVASGVLSALSSALLLWASSATIEIDTVINETLDALEASDE